MPLKFRFLTYCICHVTNGFLNSGSLHIVRYLHWKETYIPYIFKMYNFGRLYEWIFYVDFFSYSHMITADKYQV